MIDEHLSDEELKQLEKLMDMSPEEVARHVGDFGADKEEPEFDFKPLTRSVGEKFPEPNVAAAVEIDAPEAVTPSAPRGDVAGGGVMDRVLEKLTEIGMQLDRLPREMAEAFGVDI